MDLTPGQRYRLVNIPMLVGVDDDTTEDEPCRCRSCPHRRHSDSRRFHPYGLPAVGGNDYFTAVPLVPQSANLPAPTTTTTTTTTRCPRCQGERTQSPEPRKSTTSQRDEAAAANETKKQTTTSSKPEEKKATSLQEESNNDDVDAAESQSSVNARRLVELLRGSSNRSTSATAPQPVTTTIPVDRPAAGATEESKDGNGGKESRNYNKATDGGFLVTVNVDKYQAEDLQIHLDGKQLRVLGKRYETLDEDGWQVTRLKLLSHNFIVPETADVEKITSSLSVDAKTLTIEAPPKPGVKKEGVRTIEIVREDDSATRDKQADSTAATNEEKESLDQKEKEMQ